MSVAIPNVGAGRRLRAYVELTKPRISLLVVMTAVPALLLAARGFPGVRVFFGTLLGTVLASASAASFNMYFDRDLDAMMRRTAARPLPSGVLPPTSALGMGFALAALGWLALDLCGNWLAALIAMLSIFYYAVVYTVWLKRRTPQNIVIGGAAGASAPLIAWAAVTGTLGTPALLMFSIIFLWTPPHFWSLSLYRRDDYERAGLPMLPVSHGEEETRRQILLYSLALVATTLAAAPLAGLGPLYWVPAVVLGGAFLWGAWRLRLERAVTHAVWLFRFSIIYLFVLFVSLSADAVARYGLGVR
jgi:protoheme IX farnesyltransferase